MGSYPARHFSLSNPEGPTGPDVVLLLRRVADAIEAEGVNSEDILDVTLSGDSVNEHGVWWSATVYWSTDDPGQ
ncbi:hypothetical protein V6K52_03160 [Knoellia sp. S7-12]|uniref:hypothetical protein n=1 Tax=Knoellia sp. S7-12 TaxID=3126698 RepID=UPI003366066D